MEQISEQQQEQQQHRRSSSTSWQLSNMQYATLQTLVAHVVVQ
jgi:hypothetical protein